MEKLLLVAALACQPGDRLIDLSGKLPRGLQFMDLVVSVEPFYTRFCIYQLGISSEPSAMPQQQADFGFTRTNRHRSFLRETEPATDEMDGPRPP
jgi:hypothetical protein